MGITVAVYLDCTGTRPLSGIFPDCLFTSGIDGRNEPDSEEALPDAPAELAGDLKNEKDYTSYHFTQSHSVFFFKFCNTDKYPKCIGLKIGDFGFLYIFVYESKSICSRETFNTSLESSFYEAFRNVLRDCVLQILFDL